MDGQNLLFGAIASIIITVIGYFLSLENLLIFCLVIGVISFLLRFIDIHIVDLSPLIIIAPLLYVLLTVMFGTFDFTVATNTIIFLFKLIPSVIIGNLVSEILFSIGIR